MAIRIGRGEAGRASGPSRRFNRLVRGLQANTRTRARRNIGFHYDLGNDFYAAWLDETLTYSSAIFAEPIADGEPLESAQQRKRSEEHTSELQSLMRISYAVFRLKKNKTHTISNQHTHKHQS